MPTIISGDGTITGLTATGISAVQNLPAGSVLQVVSASYATETATSSNVFTSTGLTATITPKFATSKIYIVVNTQIQIDTSATICPLTIFRGTTSGTNLGNANYGFAYIFTPAAALGSSACATYLDSPATASAQQYTVAFRSTNNSTPVYANVSGARGNITLMEIAA
jgi:hypothetical protein